MAPNITRPSPGGYSRRRGRGEEAELEDEVAVVDSGGNLVAFQRMDGAMLASIQIAEHKARAATTFRRPTKIFEDGIQLMHLNYLLALLQKTATDSRLSRLLPDESS
jgi:uncharacterized protein GlcG (DUF336 family)